MHTLLANMLIKESIYKMFIIILYSPRVWKELLTTKNQVEKQIIVPLNNQISNIYNKYKYTVYLK